MDELDLRRETGGAQLPHKVSSKTALAVPVVVLMMRTAASSLLNTSCFLCLRNLAPCARRLHAKPERFLC